MFRKTLLSLCVAAVASVGIATSAQATPPCYRGGGFNGGGFGSYYAPRPVVNPYYGSAYRGFNNYGFNNRGVGLSIGVGGFNTVRPGFGYPGFNSYYRNPGFGNVPFGGLYGYPRGSGFSLYLGR